MNRYCRLPTGLVFVIQPTGSSHVRDEHVNILWLPWYVPSNCGSDPFLLRSEDDSKRRRIDSVSCQVSQLAC